MRELGIKVVDGAELGVFLAEVGIGDVEIGFFGDGDTGMTEDAGEGVDVHTRHQAALCEVVAQGVGREGFREICAGEIVLEVGLEGTDGDGFAGALGGEKEVAGAVTVFELKPFAQRFGGAGGEEHGARLAPFGDVCLQVDALFDEV